MGAMDKHRESSNDLTLHSERQLFDVGVDDTTPSSESSTLPMAKAGDDSMQRKSILLTSDTKIGQYQLIRELGRGGMGAVYLAHDTRLGRRVAIKFLAYDDRDLARRFLIEARATAQCKHDNIVDIYEVGESSGYSYMVLEYLRGMTLRHWMQMTTLWQSCAPRSSRGFFRTGRAAPETALSMPVVPIPVSPTLAVELMIPVVRALAHAHERKLVHRDLKPENIMLTDDGAIKVLDFGIAKMLPQVPITSGRYSTGNSEPMRDRHMFETTDGALPYMSPEQWGRGTMIDERSDLWAVGIMLFELCTGCHPVTPPSYERLREVVGDVEVPMLSMDRYRLQLGPLAEVVQSCLQKRVDERISTARELLIRLEALLHTHTDMQGADYDRPYVGLAAFQPADEARFFGRERDVASLMGQLRNHRLVTVEGPSGVGKSSLVRAGLLPELQRSGQPWEWFIIRPGRQPIASLATMLARITPVEPIADEVTETGAERTRIAELRRHPGVLGTMLRGRCFRRKSRCLLFVDQFEELYTLGADDEARQTFVRCLEQVVDDVSSPLRVVIAVRSDFRTRLAEHRGFTSEVVRGTMVLTSLDRASLRTALVAPLVGLGYVFENESLIARILESIQDTHAPLPLLQLTAERLWMARDVLAKCISEQGYDSIGGVEGVLAAHADAVLTGLTPHEYTLARMVFTRFDEHASAYVSLNDLRARVGADAVDDLERVVHHLAQARLVLLELDGEVGVAVKPSHDSLVEDRTKSVHGPLEDTDAVKFNSQLRASARQWEQEGRTVDLLWRGHAAERAKYWLHPEQAERLEMNGRERAFLQAVVASDASARRRRRRVVSVIITLSCTIAVALTLLATQVRYQAKRADDNVTEARRSAVVARNATRLVSASSYRRDPTMMLALIRELEPAAALPPRWRNLARWASLQDIARVVLDHGRIVSSAAFSPDGARIVTASWDNVARVWNAHGTEAPVVLVGHRDRVYSAVFSPDSMRIATASWDGTVRVWNDDGTENVTLQGHDDRVYSAAFSPDGTRVVSASWDRTARVWHADGAGQPVILRGHTDRVYMAVFSPDGARVVTASGDRTARVWQVGGRGTPVVLRGHEDKVSSVAFSPDNAFIATGSFDGTMRVWRVDALDTPPEMYEHEDRVSSVAFSSDSARIVTASFDRAVRVWRIGESRPLTEIKGHQKRVSSAQFSADGTRIVTASWDETARVWDVSRSRTAIQLRGHRERLYSAAFSPNGFRVVTGAGDNTARVWRTDGTGEPTTLKGHTDVVYSATFNPDGTRVVTGSWDRTARVWRTDGTGVPIRLEGHRDRVYAAAFSPDGTRIVTASADNMVRVWNADGTGPMRLFLGHEGPVYSVSFSPSGTRLVSASADKTARVWNVDGRGEPIRLEGHADRVFSAAFSPSGTHVVTTSWDNTVRIWSVDGLDEPIVLEGHEAVSVAGTRAGEGAFSPDGARIVTVSDDSTLRLWRADGTGVPMVWQIPSIDAYSAAFSPDGGHIVTASHSERHPSTGQMEHWATIWPTPKPFTGLDDPELWRATRYCPSVALRQRLLGITKQRAERQLRVCRARVERVHAIGRR